MEHKPDKLCGKAISFQWALSLICSLCFTKHAACYHISSIHKLLKISFDKSCVSAV